jgi:GntR family transcriptional regulator
MTQASELQAPRQRGLSLHRQVYLVLRDGINRGEYEPGAALPPEEELARRFDVSRVTVRTALAALAADGLIDRRQGRGTFVRNSFTVEPLAASMSDLVAHMRDVSRQTDVMVLELDYGPLPLTVQTRLGARHDGVHQRAVRLRSRNGKPLFHITTYVPEDLGRTYSRGELEQTPLYDLLRRAGVELHSGTQVVTAAAADPAVAGLLGVAVGEPLIVVRRTYLDRTGRLVEYLEMLASPASFELHTSLEPPDVVG